jgi:hypothetical protein
VAYARRRGGRAQERRGSSLVAHACLAAECVSLLTRRITERPTSSPVLSSNALAVRINAEPPSRLPLLARILTASTEVPRTSAASCTVSLRLVARWGHRSGSHEWSDWPTRCGGALVARPHLAMVPKLGGKIGCERAIRVQHSGTEPGAERGILTASIAFTTTRPARPPVRREFSTFRVRATGYYPLVGKHLLVGGRDRWTG